MVLPYDALGVALKCAAEGDRADETHAEPDVERIGERVATGRGEEIQVRLRWGYFASAVGRGRPIRPSGERARGVRWVPALTGRGYLQGLGV